MRIWVLLPHLSGTELSLLKKKEEERRRRARGRRCTCSEGACSPFKSQRWLPNTHGARAHGANNTMTCFMVPVCSALGNRNIF